MGRWRPEYANSPCLLLGLTDTRYRAHRVSVLEVRGVGQKVRRGLGSHGLELNIVVASEGCHTQVRKRDNGMQSSLD